MVGIVSGSGTGDLLYVAASDEFGARLKQLQAAKKAADDAVANLGIAKDARAEYDRASAKHEEAKKLLADHRTLAFQLVEDAKASAAKVKADAEAFAEKLKKGAAQVLADSADAAQKSTNQIMAEWKSLQDAIIGHSNEVEAHQARIAMTEAAQKVAQQKAAEADMKADKLDKVRAKLKAAFADL